MTTPMNLPTGLLATASARFRPAGQFAYHYARGKLAGDAIFAALLRLDSLPAMPHWLDLGCGQGSLFAWLLAAQQLHDQGQWPADWPAPPRPTQATAKKLPGSQAPLSRTRRHDQTHHDVLRHPAMRRVQATAEDAQSVVSVSGYPRTHAIATHNARAIIRMSVRAKQKRIAD